MAGFFTIIYTIINIALFFANIFLIYQQIKNKGNGTKINSKKALINGLAFIFAYVFTNFFYCYILVGRFHYAENFYWRPIFFIDIILSVFVSYRFVQAFIFVSKIKKNWLKLILRVFCIVMVLLFLDHCLDLFLCVIGFQIFPDKALNNG